MLKGRFVCVWNCLIFFLGEYSSVWREICRVLSQIQSRFLRGISGKNNFGTIFLKFCEKPRLSSSKICEISSYFLQFYYVFKNCVEKFTQVLSCAVCTLQRRHVRKQITKKRYRKEKPRLFFFRKTGFVHSRSGSCYAIFLGSFGLKILPDIRHCVHWVLA